MVDFEPTVLYLLGLIIPAMYVVAEKVGQIALAWLRTKTPFGYMIPEEVVAENLKSAIDFGVKFATVKAKETNLKVEFDNVFIQNAVTYVKDSVPDALERFNIDDQRLADMVKARL
jgi:hypothetical protein